MITAIVPARRGSKGIENKNVQRINGYTLVWHAVRCALLSKHIDNIIVTTDYDSNEVGVSFDRKKVAYLQRPERFAGDESSIYDVLRHCLNSTKDIHENVILLEPTCPTRCVDDLDAMIDLYNKSGRSNTVVSVVSTPMPLSWVCIVNSKKLAMPFYNGYKTRQNDKRVYVRDGLGYLFSKEYFVKKGSVYTKDLVPYISNHRTVNIDTYSDLVKAAEIMSADSSIYDHLYQGV